MVRSTWIAAGVAWLALVGNVQAQTVHKCIVNGAAVYQAAACPAANDQKSLVIPAAPSQQELLDATANGRLQTVQPGADAPPQATTARRYDVPKRTIIVQISPSQVDPTPAPASNCDLLNQQYQDAKYRHDELSAPGTVATRSAALQRANEDMQRAQDQAANSHCRIR